MGGAEHGKLFVGGLHWNTTSEGLRAYFERFGAVTESTVMRDAVGKSRCFGFVTMADTASVDSILSQRHILDSKQIDPKPATLNPPPPVAKGHAHVPHVAIGMGVYPVHSAGQYGHHQAPQAGNHRDECRVFVGGLALEAGEDEIRAALQCFGNIQNVALLRDRETGHSRGYAFVAFSSRDAAYNACVAANVSVCGRQVEIRPAHPKGRAPSGAAPMYPAMPLHADAYLAWAEYYRQNSYQYPSPYGNQEAYAYGAPHVAYPHPAHSMANCSQQYAPCPSDPSTSPQGRQITPGGVREDHQPFSHVSSDGSSSASGHREQTYPVPGSCEGANAWSSAYYSARGANHGDLYSDAHPNVYSTRPTGADAWRRNP